MQGVPSKNTTFSAPIFLSEVYLHLLIPKLVRSTKRRLIIILVAVTLILVAIIIVLAIVFTRDKDSKPDIPTPRPVFPPPTGPPGADGPYKHAVVASDAGPCSEIGRDILKKNGTAMDSAIAALFCIGVYNMHSAGVGGGGFIVVYKKSTKFVEVIDFREEAPGKANRTMYVGGGMSSRQGKSSSLWGIRHPASPGRFVFANMKYKEGLLLISICRRLLNQQGKGEGDGKSIRFSTTYKNKVMVAPNSFCFLCGLSKLGAGRKYFFPHKIMASPRKPSYS